MTETATKPKLVTQKEKLTKKFEHRKECEEGLHSFMITRWVSGGGKEKALQVRCQYCLMPLDLEEIESAEWSQN